MTRASARDVVELLGGHLGHGARLSRTFQVDGFDVSITVAIDRRVERSELAVYRTEALDILRREPWHRCQHQKADRSRWRLKPGTTTCDGSIAAVLVYRRNAFDTYEPRREGPPRSPHGYDFVCSTHRDHPRVAAPDLIEILRFTESERAAFRKTREKHQTEKWAEYERRRIARGKGACPVCGMPDLQIDEGGDVEPHFPRNDRTKNLPLCPGGKPAPP